MKDVISLGDGVGATGSGNSACKGIDAEGARARLNVCRKDAKLPPLEGDTEEGVGEGGRAGVFGDVGVPFRNADDALPLPTFFFPPKERRNDHSDSNWIDSSPARGE